MNLHVTGAGPSTPAQATWVRALFEVRRAPAGTVQQRDAVLVEIDAWQDLQREKAAR